MVDKLTEEIADLQAQQRDLRPVGQRLQSAQAREANARAKRDRAVAKLGEIASSLEAAGAEQAEAEKGA